MPPDLTVADQVEAGALLVEDGQLGGVLQRLLEVSLPDVARPEPFQRHQVDRWQGVAPDRSGGQQPQPGGAASGGHCPTMIPRRVVET